MLKKQFGNFGEKSRKVRVKMRKSGKHWVKSVMTQIGYVILSRFSGKEKSSKVQTTSEDLSRTKTSASILTAVAALGAVVGGTTDTTSVSAEETPTATELTGNEKTLATAETVVVAPEVKTVNSDSSSHSTSESQSMSTSTLQSTSASLSASESLMDSTSASLSESSSLSEYSSLSLSSSESVSASESVQSSEAATTARVQPRAMRVVSSASDMETLPAALISGEGDVTTVQGQDVTDKLQNLDIKLSGGVQAKAGVINMDKSESMHMSLKFTIDSVNRGDTFEIKLSDNIDTNGASNYSIVEPIKSPTGEVYATGIYDSQKKSIVYSFTDFAASKNNINGILDIPLWPDDTTVQNTKEDVLFSVKIKDQEATIKETVKYDPPVRIDFAGGVSVDSRITNIDDVGKKMTYISQINVDGKSLYNYNGLYTRIYNYSKESTADLKNSTIKIYKTTSDNIVESMVQDYSSMEDVTSKFANSYPEKGWYDIYWGQFIASNETYVIVVETPFTNAVTLNTTLSDYNENNGVEHNHT